MLEYNLHFHPYIVSTCNVGVYKIQQSEKVNNNGLSSDCDTFIKLCFDGHVPVMDAVN